MSAPEPENNGDPVQEEEQLEPEPSPTSEAGTEEELAPEECDFSGWTGEGVPWTSRPGRFARYKGSVNINDLPNMACAEGHHSTWRLRSKGYSKTKKKNVSHPQLYSFVGCELVSSANPFLNTAQKGLFGQALTGKTVTAVVIYQLRQDWAERSADDSEDGEKYPQVDLLRRFIQNLDASPRKIAEDPFLGRFKLLVKSDAGVPTSFSKFNGKPVLVTGSGQFSLDSGVLEIGVNMRAWAYPARLALYSNWNKLENYRLHVGICIEGRGDEELPEALLGCCMLTAPSVDSAPPL